MTKQPPGARPLAKETVRVFDGVVKQVRRFDALHVFLGHRVVYNLPHKPRAVGLCFMCVAAAFQRYKLNLTVPDVLYHAYRVTLSFV